MKENKKNTAIYIMLGILITIVLATIGGFWGDMNYEYQLNKCRNLNSKSYYDFSHDIQTGARYSQDCYYIENHPLARFDFVIGRSICVTLLGGLVIALIVFLKFTFKKPEKPKYIDDW